MCDVSDGLVADLGWIAAASGVRIDLDGGALRPDQPLVEMASALGVDAAQWVLAGGEDHALAATFPTMEAMASAGLDWHLVGRVAEATEVGSVTVDGEPVADRGGHDHFG
jgi:thiamine-monophosphate kinase